MSQTRVADKIMRAKAELLDDIDAIAFGERAGVNEMTWPKPVWQKGGSSLTFFSRDDVEPSVSTKPVLLICFALIYDPKILHITKSASFIESLVQNGFNVFVLDWGRTNTEVEVSEKTESEVTGDSGSHTLRYLQSILLPATQVIRAKTSASVHLLGICQGAFLTTVACALQPQWFASHIVMVAPCNTHLPDDEFANIIRSTRDLLEVIGDPIIDGRVISEFFMSLRAVTLKARKLSGIREKIKSEKYIAIEHWLRNGPPVCRQFLLEYMTVVYVENALCHKYVQLGERFVDLSPITCPVFNIIAQRDTIVNQDSSSAFKHLFNASRYQELVIDCGHIGAFIKPQIQRSLGMALRAFCDTVLETKKEEA